MTNYEYSLSPVIASIEKDVSQIDAHIASLNKKRLTLTNALASLKAVETDKPAPSSKKATAAAIKPAKKKVSPAAPVKSTVKSVKKATGPKPAKSAKPAKQPKAAAAVQSSGAEPSDQQSVFDSAIEGISTETFTAPEVKARMFELSPDLKKGLKANYVANRFDWLKKKGKIVLVSKGKKGEPNVYSKKK